MMTDKPRILITEPGEIASAAVDLLEASGYSVTESVEPHDKGKIQGLFIRTYTRVDASLLDSFPGLTFILRAGVGLDNIDRDECEKRGIAVYNSPGANAGAVAEYIVCMALFALRRIGPQIERVREDSWRDMSAVGEGIHGKTFGLVGCGNVGSRLAALLNALGAQCLGYDPYITEEVLRERNIRKTGLDQLLSESDVTVLMMPLTEETRNILSRERIRLLKQGAILINVSRGELLDETALVESLKAGKIHTAVLDVVQGEPVVNPLLSQCPNLIITPHIAGFTRESNVMIAVSAVQRLLEDRKKK